VSVPRVQLETFREAVSGGETVLVSTHIHPDPDAIGSVLAVREMIEQLGGRPVVVLQDQVPPRCRVLPGAETVVTFSENAATRRFHVAVIVDAGSLSRIGDVQALLEPDARLFNLDHHLSNERFGEVNLVSREYSATAELLYGLCNDLGLTITPTLADNLFAGLLTDTGRFRYSSTTARTFAIAADLAARGAEITRITNAMYFDISAQDILSMGAIYSSLELFGDGRISTLFARLDFLVEDPDSVVDMALSIQNVTVAALLSETPEGKIRVSLRSRDIVNVAAIAEAFGGGGHERAAGFRMRGTLESVRERLLPVLLKALEAGTSTATLEGV
jgi:phosphoesterase RecJ-like protein